MPLAASLQYALFVKSNTSSQDSNLKFISLSLLFFLFNINKIFSTTLNEIIIKDEIIDDKKYFIKLKKEKSLTPSERNILEKALDRIGYKVLDPKSIFVNQFKQTNEIPTDIDILNLLKESLGSTSNIQVVPLEEIRLSTQDDWGF